MVITRELIFVDMTIDGSLAALGIKSVVIGIARNVNSQAPFSDAFLAKREKMEKWALSCDIDALLGHPIIKGYTD